MNKVLLFIIIVVIIGGYLAFKDNAVEPLTYASVPESAKGPAIDQSKGYLVEEISDGVYWVTDGAYQTMFLTTGDGVIVVDAPPNLGNKIVQAIDEVTSEEITHLIYSHSHADHIAAASMYPENITIIAQDRTAAQIRATQTDNSPIPFGTFVGGSPVPEPTITFNDFMTLNVGNKVVELTYKGPTHEQGNTYIYVPQQKILMLVDVIFPGWTPFKDLAVAEDVSAFLASHDDILAYDFETLVSGHLTRLGTREDVVQQKEYFSDITANAVNALQTVDFNAIAQNVGFENPWLLFETYLDTLNQKCADETENKWINKLGGVDLFTKSHCARIIESLRID